MILLGCRLMVLAVACILCSINSTPAYSQNVDSLKSLAQTAPFPDRILHLIDWYQATNELFHEPEIGMVQAGVEWLENQPSLSGKDQLQWATLQLMLASMYSDNERLKDLFETCSKVIVVADSLSNESQSWTLYKGQAYFYLSKVAYLEGKPLENLRHLEKAYAAYETLGHRSLMARTLASISRVESELGVHEQAFETAGRSAQIFDEEENEKGYLRAKYYQTIDLVFMQKLTEAETLLNELIPRLQETKHPSLNIAMVSLGDVQAKQGKFEPAKVILEEALALAKERRVNFTVAEACQALANLEEDRGNFEKALFFQREHARYVDSIRLQAQEQELKEAQAKFDQTENELKIKGLEKKIADERWASRKNMLLLAVGLLAVGGLLFWLFDQKKKKEITAAARTLTVQLTKVEDGPKEPTDPVLEQFLTILQQQLCNDLLSVEGIAETMRMSRVQLFKKIKTATGASPSEIIRQYRLEAGKKLLLENDLTISEVAYKVGFSNPNSFGRAFKERFGSSPSDFLLKNKSI